ncbi:MAG: hypothetical protein WC804_07060 [Sphingomonas sp.]|jgi:hypothetical protein|uniref:hypothetical protein n=1 Tax=Sphingomonas sp. TaxID=28214 RepID=UPI003562C63E
MTGETGTPFLLIVFNRAEAIFSVEGPVRDDRAWRKAVAVKHQRGESVGFSPCLNGQARIWRRPAAQEFREKTGFKRVAKGSIVALS